MIITHARNHFKMDAFVTIFVGQKSPRAKRQSQYQYWARLIASFVSVLIQGYDHVTFYTCQS